MTNLDLQRPAAAVAPSNLSGMFDELEANVDKEHPHEGVSLSVILNAVGRRSYGPLLLVIGLIAVSPITVIPGMSWFVAFVALLIATQMLLGFTRPWLPRQVLRARVPRAALFLGLDKGRPLAERVDGLLAQRLTFMTTPPFVALVALFCIAAALVTIPLGLVPMGPVAPSVALIFFGLGMTARDGLWLAVGIALCLLAAWLVAPVIF